MTDDTRPSESSSGSAAVSPARSKRSDGSSRRARVLTIVRYILVAGVAAFAVYYFVTTWDTVAPAIARMSPGTLVASGAVLLVGLAMNVLAWTTLLGGLGHRVPLIRGAQIMLVGQLGKYIPGSAWAYLLQMELGRQYGVARARVLVASLYAAGVGVVASLILGAMILPQLSSGHPELLWLFALLPIGLACLHPWVMTLLANLVLRIFRRPPLEHRVRIGTTLGALAWSLGSYLVYGLHLWLLTDGRAQPLDVVLFASALSLGFTLSLIAFLVPSGVGVREAVLIGMLGLVLTMGEAGAIALVSRAMFTAGDLLMAGAAATIAFAFRKGLHQSDAATAEYTDVTEN